jgi:hypothetical protein
MVPHQFQDKGLFFSMTWVNISNLSLTYLLSLSPAYCINWNDCAKHPLQVKTNSIPSILYLVSSFAWRLHGVKYPPSVPRAPTRLCFNYQLTASFPNPYRKLSEPRDYVLHFATTLTCFQWKTSQHLLNSQ